MCADRVRDAYKSEMITYVSVHGDRDFLVRTLG